MLSMTKQRIQLSSLSHRLIMLRKRIGILINFIIISNLLQCINASSPTSAQIVPLSFNEAPLGLSMRPPGAELLLSIPQAPTSFRTTQAVTNAITPLTDSKHVLVMEEASVDAIFTFTAIPEPAANFSDYTVRVLCSDPSVLRVEDVTVAPPILLSDGSANFTAAISFERSVGTVEVTFELLRTDLTLYDSTTVIYVVCGMSFFYFHPKTGDRRLIESNRHEIILKESEKDGKGELLDFVALVQFPDGSTTQEIIGNYANLPPLDKITISTEGGAILAQNDIASCEKGHSADILDDATPFLPEQCSYGFSPFTLEQEPHFVCRLRPFRTGTVTFHFVYAELLRGTIYDEIYECKLQIVVSGAVPTAILGIAPPGPFRQSGGQVLTCDIVNAKQGDKYKLRLGDKVLIPTKVKSISQGIHRLAFIVPKGESQSIPWDLLVSKDDSRTFVSCPWAGEGERFVFNYMGDDIHISSLSPSFGPQEGEFIVACNGYFGNFNGSDESTDSLWFGTYKIDSESIIAVNKTSIEFEVPPRRDVQSHSPKVPCHVVVGGLRSNEVTFVYESLTHVHISVVGASYDDESGKYQVSLCSTQNSNLTNTHILLQAHTNAEADEYQLEYEWYASTVSSKKLLTKSSGSYGEDLSLSIALSNLELNESYQVTVVVKDKRFSTQMMSEIVLQTINAKRIGVGLNLGDPRTVAYPPVDTRISAVVKETDNCVSYENGLSYEWTFSSSSKSLSYMVDSTDLKTAGPRRIGREFVIPRQDLSEGMHNVKVKVFDSNDSNIYGIAKGQLYIESSPLQAIINSGERFIQTSSVSTLDMSATRSHDPDAITSKMHDKLLYAWSCELSIEGGRDFVKAVVCPGTFVDRSMLRKRTFSISPARIQTMQDSESSAFVRFSLTVSKIKPNSEFEKRSSKPAIQVAEIIFSEETLSPRGDVSLFDSEGYPIELDQVPYFEAVILTPQASKEISWEFRLLEPEKEKFSFLEDPNNVLSAPGFYNPGNLVSSRHSLGISHHGLRPSTKYTFEIRYISANGKNPGSVEFSFETIGKPSVKLFSTTRVKGNEDTVFGVTAIPSIKNIDFKYYFFVDINGRRLCIDGCSGHRMVNFRIPLEGKHSVTCVLMDSRGRHVLTQSQEMLIIEVQSLSNRLNSTQMESIEERFNSVTRTYKQGDHSSFVLECFSLLADMQQTTLSQRKDEESFGQILTTVINQLGRMYSKTNVNTPLAQDYIKLSQVASSLPLHYSNSAEDSFYSLCKMVQETMLQTGENEQLEVFEDLNATLTQLGVHAKQLKSGGTSRRSRDEINTAILDINELIIPLWAEATVRETQCGSSRMDELVGGTANITTTVSCMPGQRREAIGKYGVLKWCEPHDSKVVGVIGEFENNYLIDSGIIDNDTNLMNEDETTRSHANGLTYALIRSKEKQNGKCTLLEQNLLASDKVFNGEEMVCGDAYGIEYEERKRLGQTLQSKSYSVKRLKAGDEKKKDKVISIIEESGLYDIRRYGCTAAKITIVGQGTIWWLPLVVVFLSIGLVVFGVVIWLRRIRPEYSTVEGGDVAYIERDVYGRDVGIADELAVTKEEDINAELTDDDNDDEEIVFDSGRRGRKKGIQSVMYKEPN